MCKPDIPAQSSESRTVATYITDRVIIFDWDDTICPSTFVRKTVSRGGTFRDLPQHFQNIFDELCNCAEKALNEAKKHGEVRSANFFISLKVVPRKANLYKYFINAFSIGHYHNQR